MSFDSTTASLSSLKFFTRCSSISNCRFLWSYNFFPLCALFTFWGCGSGLEVEEVGVEGTFCGGCRIETDEERRVDKFDIKFVEQGTNSLDGTCGVGIALFKDGEEEKLDGEDLAIFVLEHFIDEIV